MAKVSEFGFEPMRNGVAPSPHIPDINERLMLLYRTGDDSGRSMPDNGEFFSGLLPIAEQTALREAEGVMVKGEAWVEIETAAEAEIAALAGTVGVEPA
jgi:hypothetical protein